ncbi:ATP-dependent DNA ligase [Streptomyces griseorubiginosus]|uniref:ATP-dependent DNA ligase n=1 Tax=Streptomyces griseorubiginosus TaxID=67304 RepID=UPI0036E646CD
MIAASVSHPVVRPGWVGEPKWDGYRAQLARRGDSVLLRSRHGTDMTQAFPEIRAAALAQLPEQTGLDGELVVWDSGRLTFERLQQRLARRGVAARAAAAWPAHYVAFDVLTLPAAGFPDLRTRPYSERRQVLLEVLAGIGPPIEPVWSTTDWSEALVWFEALEGTGVEGIIAKPLGSVYASGKRVWSKVQHADTVDAIVVGFTGTARHPKALAVRLPGRAFTTAGDTYTPADADVIVEVVAGTTRHAVVTVVRLR